MFTASLLPLSVSQTPPPPILNSLCSLFFPLCTQCIMTVSPSFPSSSLRDISFDSSLHPSLIPSPLSDSPFGLFGHRHIFSSVLTLSARVKPFVLLSSQEGTAGNRFLLRRKHCYHSHCYSPPPLNIFMKRSSPPLPLTLFFAHRIPP